MNVLSLLPLLLLLVAGVDVSAKTTSFNNYHNNLVKAPWPVYRKDNAIASTLARIIVPAESSTSNASDAALQLRGGGGVADMATDSVKGLRSYMQEGARSDVLVLLSSIAMNAPISTRVLKMSPILGFLILGTFLGPQGINVVKDLHTTEIFADLGVVLFLFEMGIHLSFKTLYEMRRTVFGLGGTQWTTTAVLITSVCSLILGVKPAAAVVIGGALALSSSAFVLQLLKDKRQMETTYGKSSFGVLLLQDLMVVPLLVIIPILAGDAEKSVGEAIGSAVLRTGMALAVIGLIGKFALVPVFDFVSSVQNQEAFVALILSTVLGMSFLTEGLGLSNTLGAFLSGVLLADTRHRHHVETEIAPFRGILVGLFFFSVGFELDLNLIATKFPQVMGIVLSILTLKAVVATAACTLFDLPMPTARRIGLVLSQGGEFAFVAFRMARSFGILDDDLCKLLLTCVSLTMAFTPFLEEFGARMEVGAKTKTPAMPAVEVEILIPVEKKKRK